MFNVSSNCGPSWIVSFSATELLPDVKLMGPFGGDATPWLMTEYVRLATRGVPNTFTTETSNRSRLNMLELSAGLWIVFHFNRHYLVRRQYFNPLVKDFVVTFYVRTEAPLQRIKSML